MEQITRELCGTTFSAGTISNLTKQLDEELNRFRNRPLKGNEYPFLLVDARYEKVRVDNAIINQAVLVIAGITDDGHREILAVDVADAESEATWGTQFQRLKSRGLRGVKLLVSDNHQGIQKAARRHFHGCIWQRCRVHYLRNMMALVRHPDRTNVVKALHYIWDAENFEEARKRVREVVSRFERRYADMATKLEESIEETLQVLALPESLRKRLASTNMIERLNQSILQRTRVARIFPNRQSCLRLVSAILLEIHEDWISGRAYMAMPEKLELNEGALRIMLVKG